MTLRASNRVLDTANYGIIYTELGPEYMNAIGRIELFVLQFSLAQMTCSSFGYR